MTIDDHKTDHNSIATIGTLDINQKLTLQNLGKLSQITLLILVSRTKILEDNKDPDKTFFFGTPLFFQYCNQFCLDFIELHNLFYSLSNPRDLNLTLRSLAINKLIDAKFSAEKSLWEVSVNISLEHAEYALVQLLSGKLSQNLSIKDKILDEALWKLALF